MKVIDLLNKIANGEEVPKKIHIKKFQSDFIFNGYTYLSDEEEPQNIYWCLHSDALNYEVEILEENNKIEKIGNDYYHKTQPEQNQIFQRKINQLIDTINEMKKGE